MKLSVFLRRAPHLDSEQFRQWWIEHTATSRQIPGLRGYRINFVQETRPYGVPLDTCRYDGTAELWFDAVDRLGKGFASDIARAAVEDADRHCSRRVEFVTEEHVVVEGPGASDGLAKVCVQLRRREDLTRADFHAWWLEHVRLSSAIPGLRGYRINLVQDVRGAGYKPEDVAFDGTAELWFDDWDAFAAGFGSEIGLRAGADAEAHCSARVRHLTRERVVA